MIAVIIYYLLILPLSWLPFSALYKLSDALYYLIYGFFKYRKTVVAGNIKRSFPDKTASQLLEIEKGFYRHLCDLVVEGIKGFSISKKEALERMTITNPEELDQYFDKGKSVVIVGGHYANWEMFALAIDHNIKHQAVALYAPLTNKLADEKVRSSRSKFGLHMLSIHEIRENLAKTNEVLTATIFGADQAPSKKQRAYWMTFLNQETPIQFGTEKFAAEYDMPVVNGVISKISRGFFEVTFSTICEDSSAQEFGFITQKHTRLLEAAIEAKPEYWLWSHKRWKRQRPEDEPLHERLPLIKGAKF